MENFVTASFKWSAEELLTAQRIHTRNSRAGRSLRRSTFILAPFVLLIGLATFLTRGFHPMALALTLMGVAILLSPLIARRIILKHYSKRPDREMIVTFEFHQDRITSKTEASSAGFEWRMISKILQTTEGFLLYPNDQIFHWVPAKAFHDGGDLEAFTRLARSKVQCFEQVA